MKIMIHKLPIQCPSCDAALHVSSLTCQACDTSIQGKFSLPALLSLSVEEQQFIMQFVMNSGSLKEMASQMKLSYPTVRNLLDQIIEKLKTFHP
jgi:hypothetical protein